VNDIDVTDKVLVGASLSYSIGSIGTLSITFKSTATIALANVIKIYDIALNTFIFSGEIKEINSRQQTHNRYVIDCVAHDYNRLIADATGITGTFTGTEKEIVTELIGTYSPSVIVGSGVVTGNSTTLTLTDNSLSEALEKLGIANSDRIWSVDPLGEINYAEGASWPHASFDFSDSPDFSTTYPYTSFEYHQSNVTDTINQVIIKTLYSGLQVGKYINVTNSVIGAPFTGETYYITSIWGRLLNTIDENIRWEFTVTLRDVSSLPPILTGHGDNSGLASRWRKIPDPTGLNEPANKNYRPIYPKHSLNINAVLKAVIRKY